MLTDRQLEQLRKLARDEEEAGCLADGLRHECDRDLAVIQDLQRNAGRLAAQRPNVHRGEQVAHLDREIERLEQRIAFLSSARDDRMRRVNDCIRRRETLTKAIDSVLEHVGSSRYELGLDYYQADPPPRMGGYAP